VLDDSIRVFRNGLLLADAQQQPFLAWRGDVRPAPRLLPIF
jgi:hypothetical protein